MKEIHDRTSSCSCVSWAFEQQIKPAARKLLLIVLADNTGNGPPSIYHLAKQTSMSIPDIIEQFTALKKDGYIRHLYGMEVDIE